MSNRYTAKVAESLKLRGWIDEIQAKALRADNARLKGEVEALQKKADSLDAFRFVGETLLRDQLATYKAAVVEAREALEKCHKTLLTLERLEGYSTVTPPNIVLQSVIKCAESLHTLSTLTGDATKTT